MVKVQLTISQQFNMWKILNTSLSRITHICRHTHTQMSNGWWGAIKPCHSPAFLGCHILYKGAPPPTRSYPSHISYCVLMATLPSRIMTSQALLPCRLCLTQFLQQPPCVSGKMDSVRQQRWLMGNSGTSEEVRCRRMNLWQIWEGEEREIERGMGVRNAYEKEQ